MKKLISGFIVIVLFSLLSSCTETVAPVLTGSISGFVSLYEEDGTSIKDRSGVKVSIEGRSNFAFTNSDGRYKLENVSAGIFNIVYEKEGFGLNKIIAREFVGGGDAFIYELPLSKLPSYNVTSLNIVKSTAQPQSLHIGGQVSDARDYYRHLILFFGEKISVSNNPQDYLSLRTIYIYEDSTSFGFPIDNYRIYFLQEGFNLGDTVYAVAYSISDYGWGTQDPLTGRYYFFNVGNSPAKSSFVLD